VGVIEYAGQGPYVRGDARLTDTDWMQPGSRPSLDQALTRLEADFNALAWIVASHSPLGPGIKFMIRVGSRSLDKLPEGIAQ
jgi:hypothetical protein